MLQMSDGKVLALLALVGGFFAYYYWKKTEKHKKACEKWLFECNETKGGKKGCDDKLEEKAVDCHDLDLKDPNLKKLKFKEVRAKKELEPYLQTPCILEAHTAKVKKAYPAKTTSNSVGGDFEFANEKYTDIIKFVLKGTKYCSVTFHEYSYSEKGLGRTEHVNKTEGSGDMIIKKDDEQFFPDYQPKSFTLFSGDEIPYISTGSSVLQPCFKCSVAYNNKLLDINEEDWGAWVEPPGKALGEETSLQVTAEKVYKCENGSKVYKKVNGQYIWLETPQDVTDYVGDNWDGTYESGCPEETEETSNQGSEDQTEDQTEDQGEKKIYKCDNSPKVYKKVNGEYIWLETPQDVTDYVGGLPWPEFETYCPEVSSDDPKVFAYPPGCLQQPWYLEEERELPDGTKTKGPFGPDLGCAPSSRSVHGFCATEGYPRNGSSTSFTWRYGTHGHLVCEA